jgi:hypothetical protein
MFLEILHDVLLCKSALKSAQGRVNVLTFSDYNFNRKNHLFQCLDLGNVRERAEKPLP